MMRVEVKPKLLRWARERAGFDLGALAHRFPQLADWERGAARPTLKQLERFAKATHTPVGYLFLQEPPIERVPIPDFRTVGNEHIERPSPDLLDTVYICQQRQEWYRDFARSMGDEPLGVRRLLAGDGRRGTDGRIHSPRSRVRRRRAPADSNLDRRPAALHRAGRCAGCADDGQRCRRQQ